MGHIRLGRLPQSKKWRQVIDLISGGADVRDIAAATSAAAERSMIDASKDPAVKHAFWLLTQLPLAARKEQFASELRRLGLNVGDHPTLIDIATALTQAVDRRVVTTGGRTDVGEMAQLSAAQSLNGIVGRELPSLFGTTSDDVKRALGGMATVKQFSVLAQDFFAQLTRRHLNYYLSREIPNHVGVNSRFQSLRQHQDFDQALDVHCREAARIIKQFSGEWYSKQNYEGGIDEAKAGRFVHVAFDKIRKELRRRRGADD